MAKAVLEVMVVLEHLDVLAVLEVMEVVLISIHGIVHSGTFSHMQVVLGTQEELVVLVVLAVLLELVEHLVVLEELVV